MKYARRFAASSFSTGTLVVPAVNVVRAGLIAVAVASLALAFAPVAVAVPPTNDDFANAPGLTGGSFSLTGTNVEATKETGEPNHAGDPGGASIWYSYQPPQNGLAIVDTCASNFDTLLGIYTGSAVNALSEVASNDNQCSLQSSVSFQATAGTTYLIAVDGFAGDTGAVGLSLELLTPPAPANDDFANAEVLSGSSGSLSGTNVAATKETGEPNHAGDPGGASVWYSYQPPQDGLVTVHTCDSDFDTVLAVWTGSSVNALTEVGSDDDSCGNQSSVSFQATAGTTYRIAVDGHAAAQGQIAGGLEFETTLPPSPALIPPASAPSGTTGAATQGTANPKCRKAKRRAKRARKAAKRAKRAFERVRKRGGKKAAKRKARKGLTRKRKRFKKAKRRRAAACKGSKGG